MKIFSTKWEKPKAILLPRSSQSNKKFLFASYQTSTVLANGVRHSLQCQILEKTAIQYFKTEKVVSLRSVYIVKVFNISDPFYCPFSSISFDDYSIFFWYKSICSTLYKVCAVLMRHTHNTCEGVQYQWGTTLSTHERLLVNSNKLIKFPSRYWTTLRILQVCFKSIVCVLGNYLSHDNLKKQLPAHFYGHAIIVMNILCLGGPKVQGQKLSFLIWMQCFHWLLSQILIDNNKLDKASIMTS